MLASDCRWRPRMQRPRSTAIQRKSRATTSAQGQTTTPFYCLVRSRMLQVWNETVRFHFTHHRQQRMQLHHSATAAASPCQHQFWASRCLGVTSVHSLHTCALPADVTVAQQRNQAAPHLQTMQHTHSKSVMTLCQHMALEANTQCETMSVADLWFA